MDTRNSRAEDQSLPLGYEYGKSFLAVRYFISAQIPKGMDIAFGSVRAALLIAASPTGLVTLFINWSLTIVKSKQIRYATGLACHKNLHLPRLSADGSF